VKYKSIPILILCVFLAGATSAQTDNTILGSGTPNFIPQFTGQRTLGNSNIVQAGNSVGVKTTSPQATLDVESTDVFSILGVTSSTALFAAGVLGQSPSASGNGVVGEATPTSGTSNGGLAAVPGALESPLRPPPPATPMAYLARPRQRASVRG
jgi:hypothetical protein